MRREVAAPTTMSIFFFSLESSWIASATEEVVSSVIMSTFSTSYQRRAIDVGEIRLVLVIGGDELDLLAKHLAAEILDRHLGGFDRPFAAVVGIDAGLVVEDADLDALRKGRRGQQQSRRCDSGQKC